MYDVLSTSTHYEFAMYMHDVVHFFLFAFFIFFFVGSVFGEREAFCMPFILFIAQRFFFVFFFFGCRFWWGLQFSVQAVRCTPNKSIVFFFLLFSTLHSTGVYVIVWTRVCVWCRWRVRKHLCKYIGWQWYAMCSRILISVSEIEYDVYAIFSVFFSFSLIWRENKSNSSENWKTNICFGRFSDTHTHTRWHTVRKCYQHRKRDIKKISILFWIKKLISVEFFNYRKWLCPPSEMDRALDFKIFHQSELRLEQFAIHRNTWHIPPPPHRVYLKCE